MPSATRAEALVGIREVKDGALDKSDMHSGPAINARIEQLPHFPPLGPVDMLYVRKRYVPVVGAPKIYGYYHFVRAVDVSSVAAASAYIVDVVRNTGLDHTSGWEVASSFGGFEVASATFVAYNIIKKADVYVHVDFPGSTTARATDANGHDVPIDEPFWQEIFVSSFVRHLASHGEKPLYPCLRVLSYTPRHETAFLDAAAACAHRWHFSGTDGMQDDTESASKSRIAKIIRDHLIRLSRYDAVISFFSRDRLREVDPILAVYAATGARLKGDIDAATRLVDDVINLKPKSDLAWMERARICRTKGRLEEALEAAKTATKFVEDEADIWILIADLYADTRQYAKAFESLNFADMPPPSLDPYLRKLVPNRKNLTSPLEGASRGTDAVMVLVKKLREEKNFTNDKIDSALFDLPARMLTDAEHECYAILVKILKDLSWDDMLAVRGECFVMEADVQDGRLDETTDEEDDAGEDDASEITEESGERRDGDGAEVHENHDESNGHDGIGSLQENGESERAASDDTKINIDHVGDSQGEIANGTEIDVDGHIKKKARKIGKQVCKPWLDYLVLNMYNDLKAMSPWNFEEERHATSIALASTVLAQRSQSENSAESPEPQDIEAPELEHRPRRSALEIVRTTTRPPTDWLRRGELAIRLGNREEGKTALEVCKMRSEKEKTVTVTALLSLMKLAAEDGDVKTTLRCANEVWTFMDIHTDRKQSSDPSPAVPPVRSTIFKLISKKGLRTVREIAYQVEIDRKRIESLLLDAVDLGVEGFSL